MTEESGLVKVTNATFDAVAGQLRKHGMGFIQQIIGQMMKANKPLATQFLDFAPWDMSGRKDSYRRNDTIGTSYVATGCITYKLLADEAKKQGTNLPFVTESACKSMHTDIYDEKNIWQATQRMRTQNPIIANYAGLQSQAPLMTPKERVHSLMGILAVYLPLEHQAAEDSHVLLSR